MEKVPSELRTASILATWLAETQAASVEVPVGQRGLEASGLWSKFVFAVAVAVRVPRVGEVMVTVLELRVKALITLLLLRLTARVAPEIETALLRLRSMPMPVTPL